MATDDVLKIMAEAGCRSSIAEDAEVGDYLPRLLRDNGLIGDHWVGLFNCAGVQALDLAGSTLWQSEHTGAEWQRLVDQMFKTSEPVRGLLR